MSTDDEIALETFLRLFAHAAVIYILTRYVLWNMLTLPLRKLVRVKSIGLSSVSGLFIERKRPGEKSVNELVLSCELVKLSPVRILHSKKWLHILILAPRLQLNIDIANREDKTKNPNKSGVLLEKVKSYAISFYRSIPPIIKRAGWFLWSPAARLALALFRSILQRIEIEIRNIEISIDFWEDEELLDGLSYKQNRITANVEVGNREKSADSVSYRYYDLVMDFSNFRVDSRKYSQGEPVSLATCGGCLVKFSQKLSILFLKLKKQSANVDITDLSINSAQFMRLMSIMKSSKVRDFEVGANPEKPAFQPEVVFGNVWLHEFLKLDPEFNIQLSNSTITAPGPNVQSNLRVSAGKMCFGALIACEKAENDDFLYLKSEIVADDISASMISPQDTSVIAGLTKASVKVSQKLPISLGSFFQHSRYHEKASLDCCIDVDIESPTFRLHRDFINHNDGRGKVRKAEKTIPDTIDLGLLRYLSVKVNYRVGDVQFFTIARSFNPRIASLPVIKVPEITGEGHLEPSVPDIESDESIDAILLRMSASVRRIVVITQSEEQSLPGLSISAINSSFNVALPFFIRSNDSLSIYATIAAESCELAIERLLNDSLLRSIEILRKDDSFSAAMEPRKAAHTKDTRFLKILQNYDGKLNHMLITTKSEDRTQEMKFRVQGFSFAQRFSAVESDSGRSTPISDEFEGMNMRNLDDHATCGPSMERHIRVNSICVQDAKDVELFSAKNLDLADSEEEKFVKIHLKTVNAALSVGSYVSAIIACLPVHKAVSTLKKFRSKKSTKATKVETIKKNLKFDVEGCALTFNLPEEVCMQIKLRKIKAMVSKEKIMVSSDVVEVLVPRKDEHQQWISLFLIESPSAVLEDVEDKGVVRKCIKADINDSILTIPHKFVLSDVIENANNSVKAIKSVNATYLGIESRHRSQKEYLAGIPIIKIGIRKFVFKIADSPFESALNRNYYIGYQEQSQRRSRLKAFHGKFNQARQILENYEFNNYDARDFTDKMSKNVIEAYYLLQKLNSANWFKRVEKEKPEDPPLMTTVLKRISLTIGPPVLPGITFEESISILDDQVPSSYDYDEIIPRQIFIGIEDMQMRLRDYPLPVLQLSSFQNSPGGFRGLKAEGLVILAEQFCGEDSRRYVQVPVFENSPPVTIFRTINPMKVYSNMEITVNTPNKTFFCWGPSIDPAFTDMSRVFDSFTKPNVDPSPQIPW